MSNASTRERILDRFTDQLLDAGYRGISMRRVAEEVGIRRPSIYHHFPGGKEEVFKEVALRMIDADAARVQATLSGGGELRARLHDLALLHSDDPRKETLDLRLYDATRYVSEATRSHVSTRYVEGLLRPVEGLMAEAVVAGELVDYDPEFLASTFLELAAVVRGIPEDVAMPPAERSAASRSIDETAAQVVELFLSGAGVQGEETSS